MVLKVVSVTVMVILEVVRLYTGFKRAKANKEGFGGYLGNFLYVFGYLLLMYFAGCFTL